MARRKPLKSFKDLVDQIARDGMKSAEERKLYQNDTQEGKRQRDIEFNNAVLAFISELHANQSYLWGWWKDKMYEEHVIQVNGRTITNQSSDDFEKILNADPNLDILKNIDEQTAALNHNLEQYNKEQEANVEDDKKISNFLEVLSTKTPEEQKAYLENGIKNTTGFIQKFCLDMREQLNNANKVTFKYEGKFYLVDRLVLEYKPEALKKYFSEPTRMQLEMTPRSGTRCLNDRSIEIENKLIDYKQRILSNIQKLQNNLRSLTNDPRLKAELEKNILLAERALEGANPEQKASEAPQNQESTTTPSAKPK